MDFSPAPQPPALATPNPDRGTGGFLVNFSDIAAAQAATKLDIQSFAAEAGAFSHIGSALENTGEAFGKLAEEQHRVVNQKRILEADAKLNAATKEIAARVQQEKDETKWPGIFAEESAKWRRVLVGDKTLSPSARDAIDAKYSAWHIEGESGVKVSSYQRSVTNLATQYGGAIATAAQDRDSNKARTLTADMHARGLLTPEQYQGRVQDIDRDEQGWKAGQQKAALTAAIKQNPRKYVDDPAALGKMPPGLVDEFSRAARKELRSQVATTLDDFDKAAAAGQLDTPDKVAAWQKARPVLSESISEKMRQSLSRRGSVMMRDVAAHTAPETESRLLSEIDAFDPDTSTEDQCAELKLRVQELPPAYQKLAGTRLQQRWSGERGSGLPDPETALLARGNDLLDRYLKGGQFGSHTHEHTVRDSRGREVRDDAGKPRTFYEQDGREYAAALKAKSEAGGRLRRWLALNPKATEAAVEDRVLQELPFAARLRLLRLFDPPSTPAPRPPLAAAVNPPGGPNKLDHVPDHGDLVRVRAEDLAGLRASGRERRVFHPDKRRAVRKPARSLQAGDYLFLD